MSWALVSIAAGIPALLFFMLLFVPFRKERSMAYLVFHGTLTAWFLLCLYTVASILNPEVFNTVCRTEIPVTEAYVLRLSFYVDGLSLTFLHTSFLLSVVIFRYSEYYMHMERGYRRFFYTLLLFQTGFNLAVMSGNMDTLFIGWEMLGIASFMLIGFYRNRYLPVRNSVRVYSVYRMGDLGMLFSMWGIHHLMHGGLDFERLATGAVQVQPSAFGVAIGLLIVLAAFVKSAQFPFSSWLPRAMEGPTPSSAIFYGALSVHLGVFLLLRTYSVWSVMPFVSVFLGIAGMITAVTAYFSSRVQHTVKARIAYASVAQIGLMMIEISLGLTQLALLHMLGNAFLRTYQLLVSPSVVSYTIRELQYKNVQRPVFAGRSWLGRLYATVFSLSIQEWHLDQFSQRLFFSPGQWLGRKLARYPAIVVLAAGLMVLCIAIWTQDQVGWARLYFSPAFAVLAVGTLFTLRAFGERKQPIPAWSFVAASHGCITLAIGLNENLNWTDAGLYLSGIVLSYFPGVWILHRLGKMVPRRVNLLRYQGNILVCPKFAAAFFLITLAMSGFPVTPTFLGEDVLLGHIQVDQPWMALMFAYMYLMNGVVLIRLYARLFLGAPQASEDSLARPFS